MGYQNILTSIQGRVGIITMNRPDKLNAMTPKMDYEIRDQIAAWNVNSSIGAIVLTGNGRGFCSGADISRFETSSEDHGGQSEMADDNDTPLMANENWIDVIKTAKPVVAAINGVAVGEGLTRTLPCDVRIASETAQLSFRFLRVGLTPEFASTHYAVYLIGLGRTLELMLTGELISAAEAFRIGLVNHICPADGLLEKATKIATSIADNPSWNLSQVKRLVHKNYPTHNIETILSDENRTFANARASNAHREALNAFREKRSPSFH